MDELTTYVYFADQNEWTTAGSVKIPVSLSRSLAILIGEGLAFESDWIPGSVNLKIERKKIDGTVTRLLEEGE